MNRREYFLKRREELLKLDDGALGAYLLHFGGEVVYRRDEIPPLEINHVELHRRLWPSFSEERWNEHVGKLESGALVRHLSCLKLQFPSNKVKERYESAVFAVGQRARALLTGNRAALWNVANERRAALEATLKNEEGWAVEAERHAAELRARAETTRAELNTVLDELAKLG